MTDAFQLVYCACGLAKYAYEDADGEWTFACEDCDMVPAPPLDDAS